MNAETVFSLSILFIILFLFGWFASRPEPEPEPIEVIEAPWWLGLAFWGFWLTWAVLMAKNAGAVP